jgi:hypothetical protein
MVAMRLIAARWRRIDRAPQGRRPASLLHSNRPVPTFGLGDRTADAGVAAYCPAGSESRLQRQRDRARERRVDRKRRTPNKRASRELPCRKLGKCAVCIG